MFQSLTDKINLAIKGLKGNGKITEVNVSQTLKDVRKSLIEADVNFKIAKSFIDTVKEKALGQHVLSSISPGQLMVKIINEELIILMGHTNQEIELTGNPTIILMAGLQGSGKTTFSGKLANYFKTKKGKKPLLVACDVYRPAAIDQLTQLATQIGVDIYTNVDEKNPVLIAQAAIKQAKENGNSVVIIDTAGRLAIDEKLMTEITEIKQAVNPSEILFVIDAMTGQDAVNTAKAFNDALDFTGVIVTKVDGDTRGGAVITVKATVGKPIKFIGVGEKMDAIDVFYPDRMASRILGMGDVVSLVEKAQTHFDNEALKKINKKIAQNKFDLSDFLTQIKQVNKVGSAADLVKMMPGIDKKLIPKADVQEKNFKTIEVVINSMTMLEKTNPNIIDQNRKLRIAKGSGTSINDVNKILKQFEDAKNITKMMQNPNQMKQLASKFMGGHNI